MYVDYQLKCSMNLYYHVFYVPMLLWILKLFNIQEFMRLHVSWKVTPITKNIIQAVFKNVNLHLSVI